MDKGAKSQPPRKNVDNPKTPSSRNTRKRKADDVEYPEDILMPLPEQIPYRYNDLLYKHDCLQFEFYAFINRVILNGQVGWLDRALYGSVERRETPLVDLMMLHERYTLDVRPDVDIRSDPSAAKRKSYKKAKFLNLMNDPADKRNLSYRQLRDQMTAETRELCGE